MAMNNTKGILGGIAKGVIAGAAATFVMDRVTSFIYERQDKRTILRETIARVEGKEPSHALANKIARRANIDIHLGQPHPLGIGLHYVTGILPAVGYNFLRRRVDPVGKGKGLLLGLSTFVLLEQVISPLVGASNKPNAYPMQTHLRNLAGHLVFGATTYGVLRLLQEQNVEKARHKLVQRKPDFSYEEQVSEAREMEPFQGRSPQTPML